MACQQLGERDCEIEIGKIVAKCSDSTRLLTLHLESEILPSIQIGEVMSSCSVVKQTYEIN